MGHEINEIHRGANRIHFTLSKHRCGRHGDVPEDAPIEEKARRGGRSGTAPVGADGRGKHAPQTSCRRLDPGEINSAGPETKL